MNAYRHPLAFACLAVAAAAMPALAQDSAPPAARVHISAPAAGPSAFVLRDLDQRYELSNGRTTSVTAFGDVLQMRYARRSPVLLYRSAAGSWSSRDGRLVLSFEADGRGGADRVRLAMPADWA